MTNAVPAWLPAHTYALGARVSKVVDDGWVFYASVGGLSGNAEPVWPDPYIPPHTVVDNAVTWSQASSIRQQTVTGVGGVLTAFQVANPALLVQTMSARPRSASTVSLPCAYIDARQEQTVFIHDIRQTTLTTPVVVLVQVSDNEQAEAQMDAIMDGLRDAFTLAYHAVNNVSITSEGLAQDADIPELGIPTLGNVISIVTTIAEGRR